MKRTISMLLAALMLFGLAACSGNDQPGSSDAGAVSSADAPNPNADVKVMLSTNVMSLDTNLATDGDSFEVIADCIDGLMQMDAELSSKLKEQEYVLASRTLGAGSFHIIFKEILPNTIGPIITQVMFSIPTAIFTEAFLSFVGVGIVLPQCSIGSLIEDGFNNITTLPYQIFPPIVALALLMLGFNFIGDGFREALAPKLEDM